MRARTPAHPRPAPRRPGACAAWRGPRRGRRGAPWWQVLAGSRPTNLWQPATDTEVQEVKTTKTRRAPSPPRSKSAGSRSAAWAPAPFGRPLRLDRLSPPIEERRRAPRQRSKAPTAPARSRSAAARRRRRTVHDHHPRALGAAGRGDARCPWQEAPSAAPPSAGCSEGSGRLAITLTNLGDAPLDAHLDAASDHRLAARGRSPPTASTAVAGRRQRPSRPGRSTARCQRTALVDCSFEGVLPPYEAIEVEVLVALEGRTAAGRRAGAVSVSGGGAPAAQRRPAARREPRPGPLRDRILLDARRRGGRGAGAAGAGAPPLPADHHARRQLRPPGRRRAARRRRPSNSPPCRATSASPCPPGWSAPRTAVPTCELATSSLREAERAGSNDAPTPSAVGVASVTVIEGSSLGLAASRCRSSTCPPATGEPARFGFIRRRRRRR